MPGGPSFSVTTSIAGPPCMRRGSQASSMPRVTASVEFGLTTSILLIGLADQKQQCGTGHALAGPRCG
jgi:hypothetical protein